MMRYPYPFSLAGTLLTGALLAAVTPAKAQVRPLGSDAAVQSTVGFDPGTGVYELRASGSQVVSYTIDTSHQDVASGVLRIGGSLDGGPVMMIIAGAGARYRDGSGRVLDPPELAAIGGTSLADHRIDGDTVVLEYRERPGPNPLEKSYRLRLQGYTLVVELRSSATWGTDGYAGVTLGATERIADASVVNLPYLREPVVLLPGGACLTAYVDPTVSSSAIVDPSMGPGMTHGVHHAHSRTTLLPDTAGVAPPLDETAYITLSGEIADTFPMARGPASPYRSALSSRVVADIWTAPPYFGFDEGAALAWTAPESGSTHVTLDYADEDPSCGDGVLLSVLLDGAVIERIRVLNGATSVERWEQDLFLTEGDEIQVRLGRAGNHYCDLTEFRVVFDTPSDLYDQVTDFSGTQGGRGFRYLEYINDTVAEMTWNGVDAWCGIDGSNLWSWGGRPARRAPTDWLDAAAMVERYDEYGLSDIALIFHRWQRWGWGCGLPDHHPAGAWGGTEQEFVAFARAAREAGMMLALHHNYTDMDQDDPPDCLSPLWDPTAIALNPDGSWKLGFLNPYSGRQSYRIASHRMLGFAALECPDIAADYGPGAAFLDVNTSCSPYVSLDFNAATGFPPTLADTYDTLVAFFDAMKDFYDGPLFGEASEGPGRFDSYYAGPTDAVERQVERKSAAWVAPDYELLAVQPRQFNHGLGYYTRYFPGLSRSRSPERFDPDQYRATEIAFGHAGFLGDDIAETYDWMPLHGPEYWLLRALAERYGNAAATQVTYEDGAGGLDLEAALRAGLRLTNAKVTIEYDDGLVVHVNRDAPGAHYSAAGDFDTAQGMAGWRYFEEEAGGRRPMTWDPEGRTWRGSGVARLDMYGGLPSTNPVVRTWTSPVDTVLTITGAVADLDSSCGDGILARILNEGRMIWECGLPEDPLAPCSRFSLVEPVSAGDEIAFVIDPIADYACDETRFHADILYDDGQDHTWTVATPDGDRVIPPSGFLAWAPDGFRAWSALGGTGREEYVSAGWYHFARSRSGGPAQIEEIATDGAIAVVHGRDGDDLHAIQITQAEWLGSVLLLSSSRADVNLTHLDPRSARLTVRDPASHWSTDITWGALPPLWREILTAHPGDVEILPCDFDGAPTGPPGAHSWDVSDNLIFPGLIADRHYLVRLTSECIDDAECGPFQRCETGRCERYLTIRPVLRQGDDVILFWTDDGGADYVVRRSADPSDFSAASSRPSSMSNYRDTGAAGDGESYFYLVD